MAKDVLGDSTSAKQVKIPRFVSYVFTANQGCSRDRLVGDQNRDRKMFPRPRPRPRPVLISILALRPRPAKFETKTETEKMMSSLAFSIF